MSADAETPGTIAKLAEAEHVAAEQAKVLANSERRAREAASAALRALGETVSELGHIVAELQSRTALADIELQAAKRELERVQTLADGAGT